MTAASRSSSVTAMSGPSIRPASAGSHHTRRVLPTGWRNSSPRRSSIDSAATGPRRAAIWSRSSRLMSRTFRSTRSCTRARRRWRSRSIGTRLRARRTPGSSSAWCRLRPARRPSWSSPARRAISLAWIGIRMVACWSSGSLGTRHALSSWRSLSLPLRGRAGWGPQSWWRRPTPGSISTTTCARSKRPVNSPGRQSEAAFDTYICMRPMEN